MIKNQFWHQDTPGVNNSAQANDFFAHSLSVGDFDGNGLGDLAIGVRGEEISNQDSAGAVNVLFGSVNGLTASGDQLWSQNNPAIAGVSNSDDFFGFSTVTGDFDGDGRDDLAIGAPGDNADSNTAEGVVNVLYGSNTGLTAIGNQLWSQEDFFVPSATIREFGGDLTAGDFNGDGRDDLVIRYEVAPQPNDFHGGGLRVLYGTSNGLTASGWQGWYPDDGLGDADQFESGDFGEALATGDFDGDGTDDLAVGAPLEDLGDTSGATSGGTVNVIYGSGTGLDYPGNQLWTQNTHGVRGKAEEGDYFGTSLAAGDFDGDGYDDLAVGSREGIGTIHNAGAVNVLYGSGDGLTAEGNQIWHQNRPGIKGVAKSGDLFGAGNTAFHNPLGVGDFNGDGFDDLAIGVLGEDLPNAENAGAVNVIYGSSDGLTAKGNQLWHQNTFGIKDVAELEDNFGHHLGVGDLNGDGIDDLVIGVMGENINGIVNAGAVNVLYGSTNGLTTGTGSLAPP